MACAALGLVALPALVASLQLAPVWLIGEVLLSVAILALFPALSRGLAEAIGVLTRGASPVTASQTRLIARLLVVAAMLIAVQAMLRRPLALTLNSDGRAALTVESAVAALALTLVLALGVWLFETARPVVQALTLRTIDAAVPTIGAAPLVEPTRGWTALEGEATVLAASRPSDADATMAYATDAEATVADDADTTIIEGTPAAFAVDPEATITDTDATLRVERPRR